MLLEEPRVAVAFHVVIANVEREGHDAAKPVEVLFRDGPFLAPVVLDDVADVGEEDDLLLCWLVRIHSICAARWAFATGASEAREPLQPRPV